MPARPIATRLVAFCDMCKVCTYTPLLCAGGAHMPDDNDEIRGIIIHPETGELIGELAAGDRVVRKASVAYLENTQVWRMENFYKGHSGELNKWMQELSVSEKAFLFSVVPYIGYEDCCLKHSNGRPLGTEDLV